MKYTNYIINEHPVQFDELGVIALPAAVVAVPVMIGFLGGAVLMDGGRLIKLRYLLYQRQQRRVRYLKSVVISLDHDVNEWIILRAA
jgi:hypothetical protein